MKRIETILTLEAGLITMFISSNFLLFVWGNTVGYYLLTVFASFFGGVLNVEFESGLKSVSVAYIAASILFISLYISPPMLYGEAYLGQINSMVAVVTTQLARTVIMSFPLSVFTCLFGCFSGKTLTKS